MSIAPNSNFNFVVVMEIASNIFEHYSTLLLLSTQKVSCHFNQFYCANEHHRCKTKEILAISVS